MTATEPRSGDNGLTDARTFYPQGAAGWMAFLRAASALFRTARERHNRHYLEYDEWNRFFKLAIRYGCVERAELSGEIIPLEEYARANPRANKQFGLLFRALLVETFRQCRERKAAGDSAYQFAMWQRDRCAADRIADAARASAANETRDESVSHMTLHERKRRRPKPDDD
jgi:hypothetical protein